jgi:hypothetical protein
VTTIKPAEPELLSGSSPELLKIDGFLWAIRQELLKAIEDSCEWAGNMAAEDVLDEPVDGFERGHLTGKVTITINIEAHSNCPNCGKDHRKT